MNRCCTVLLVFGPLSSGTSDQTGECALLLDALDLLHATWHHMRKAGNLQEVRDCTIASMRRDVNSDQSMHERPPLRMVSRLAGR